MSLLALSTWAAVGVLVLGSSAVFVWFLMDVGRVLGGEDGEEGEVRGRGMSRRGAEDDAQ